MAAAPWDAVGTRVDKYVIVKFIGQGGGGVVHEVESTDSRERFAMKTTIADSPDGLRAALQEMSQQSGLKHALLLPLQRPFISELGGTLRLHFIFELQDGSGHELLCWLHTADARMRTSKAFRDALFWTLAPQLLVCLCYIHGTFKIHCDVKPANVLYIFINGFYTFKLGDFGLLCNAPRGAAAASPAHGPGGTPGYMAPEVQGAAAAGWDHRIDLYSLGLVLLDFATACNASAAAAHVLPVPGAPPGGAEQLLLVTARLATLDAAGADTAVMALLHGLLAPDPDLRADSLTVLSGRAGEAFWIAAAAGVRGTRQEGVLRSTAATFDEQRGGGHEASRIVDKCLRGPGGFAAVGRLFHPPPVPVAGVRAAPHPATQRHRMPSRAAAAAAAAAPAAVPVGHVRQRDGVSDCAPLLPPHIAGSKRSWMAASGSDSEGSGSESAFAPLDGVPPIHPSVRAEVEAHLVGLERSARRQQDDVKRLRRLLATEPSAEADWMSRDSAGISDEQELGGPSSSLVVPGLARPRQKPPPSNSWGPPSWRNDYPAAEPTAAHARMVVDAVAAAEFPSLGSLMSGLEPSAGSQSGPEGAYPSLPLPRLTPAAGLTASVPPPVRTTRGGGAASTAPPVVRRDKAFFARKEADRAANVLAHSTLPLTPKQMEALRVEIRDLPADDNRTNRIRDLVKLATRAVKWAQVPFAGSVLPGAPVDAYINYFIGMHGLFQQCS